MKNNLHKYMVGSQKDGLNCATVAFLAEGVHKTIGYVMLNRCRADDYVMHHSFRGKH